MSNTGIFLSKIACEDREVCTSDKYHCRTCLRNKANRFEDKFSLKKDGYNPLNKWLK